MTAVPTDSMIHRRGTENVLRKSPIAVGSCGSKAHRTLQHEGGELDHAKLSSKRKLRPFWCVGTTVACRTDGNT